jgi:predicted ribosome quality control (RQC) complex YloA/Tae2 family protein
MFDSLTLAAIREELRPFVGGRVQSVVQLDALSIGLELYNRGQHGWLFATADPEKSGLWLVEERLGQAPGLTTPLLLMLRKWARGARLAGVEQPAFERVLHLHVEVAPYVEQPGGRRLVLIVEATGRLANLILVDETGLVMDAIKRVPPTINRVRSVLPRRPYVGPPPQEKATPLEVDTALLAAALARGAGAARPAAAATALVQAVRGISPLTAREAVFRAAGRAEATAGEVDPARLAGALAELVAPLRPDSGAPWLPSLAAGEDGYTAFAPFPLTHAGPYEPTDTVSEAVQRFFGGRAAPRSTTGQAQASLTGEIRAALDRERRRLESIERQLGGAAEAESLREAGELLLAYSSQIPAGAERADLLGREVALDPTLTAVENARAYFERYTRARDAARRLPEMVEEARSRVAELAEAQVHADLADSPNAVAALRRELLDAGALGSRDAAKAGQPPRSGARPRQPAAPLKTTLDGHQLLIGRTAAQNAAALDLAAPEDLWLHARGFAGAHVILRGSPQEETIRRAAEIAAYHSEARGAGSVPVDVTARRNVRKIKGGHPGAVTYRGERTLSVTPTRAG